MTIYYVDPSAALGTRDGLTKENAFLSLAAAFAVATGNGDEIRCANNRYDSLAADTTYTIAANNLSVVSWNFSTDVKELGFSVGHFTQNRSITFTMAATPGSGLRVLRMYGIAFIISGTTTDSFNLFTAVPGMTVFWESCSFVLQNTSVSCRVNIGGSGENHGIQFFLGCYFSRAKAAQVIVLGDHLIKFINCEFQHTEDAAYGAVFNGVEQGPDTILEDCSVFGNFYELITATTVSGTRAVRLVRGTFIVPNKFSVLFGSGETGLWGFEREFVDVTLYLGNSGQTAKYSALYGPGRFYEFTLPTNPAEAGLEKPLAIYVSGELAASDYAAFARPIATLRAKQADDSIPSFWRFYLVRADPGDPPAGSLCITASLEYEGVDGGRMVRLHTYTPFEPDNLSPTLVLDSAPPAEIANHIAYLGAETAYYFDVPASWLYYRGAGLQPFSEYTSWELAVKVHLRNGFSCHIAPFILPDGALPEGATINMEGGCFLQTIQTAGGGGYPDPIPGYKAVEIIDGKLTQVDVTLNDPPTGTPAVWDGTVLRSLLPGESVILQNP